MSTQTTNLSLKKWDVNNTADLNSGFDIPGALNDNWDKIDTKAGQIDTAISNLQTNKANASDVNNALATKEDKIAGKGLSTNDFTNEYKNDVDSNTQARHTHTNKSVLDEISSSDITNWNNKQNAITSNNKLNADLVDDTSSTHKFTTAGDISKLSGIESNAEVNIIEDVKVDGMSLEITDKTVNITGKENTSNKVTTIDDESTDTQYPSAKCVYDSQINQDNRIAELEAENERLKEDIAGLTKTKEETGERIDITDSAEMRFAKFGVSGNSKQDTSKITYTCNGTETGMYYFTYNNTNYQFTMPTIEEGDILVFDTVTLKLYLGETEITTETGTTGTQLIFNASPNPDYPQEIHSVGDNVNLFDKDNVNIINASFNAGGVNTLVNNASTTSIYIPCKPNTTYVLTKTKGARFFVGYTTTIPAIGTEVFGRVGSDNGTTFSITTNSNATNIVAFVYNNTIDTTLTLDEVLNTLKIEQRYSSNTI